MNRAGSEEPNALVEVLGPKNQTPNVRATVQEVFEGLVAQSQKRSAVFDIITNSVPEEIGITAG